MAPDETRVEVGVAPDGSAWRTSTLLALSSVGTDAFALDAFGEVPPVVSAIAVLQFLEIWNSYLWPIMVTRGPEYRPLSVAMSAYFNTNQASWGNIMAFAVCMAIPVILFFLLIQKQFIASVVSSGVKG